MKLIMDECTQKESSEEQLITELSTITIIHRNLKIIEISDNIMNKMNDKQKLYFKELKKYKYSLQYIIE